MDLPAGPLPPLPPPPPPPPPPPQPHLCVWRRQARMLQLVEWLAPNRWVRPRAATRLAHGEAVIVWRPVDAAERTEFTRQFHASLGRGSVPIPTHFCVDVRASGAGAGAGAGGAVPLFIRVVCDTQPSRNTSASAHSLPPTTLAVLEGWAWMDTSIRTEPGPLKSAFSTFQALARTNVAGLEPFVPVAEFGAAAQRAQKAHWARLEREREERRLAFILAPLTHGPAPPSASASPPPAAALAHAVLSFTPRVASLVAAGARAAGGACPITLEPLASCASLLVPPCLHVCAYAAQVEALEECPTCRMRVAGQWARVDFNLDTNPMAH